MNRQSLTGLLVACALALTSLGCTGIGRLGDLRLVDQSLQNRAEPTARPQDSAELDAGKTATRASAPSAPTLGPAENSPVALVSHQHTASGGSVELSAPVYSPENYPGAYETAGFRSRFNCGLECGNQCHTCQSDCQYCPTPNNLGSPNICQFPGDPNEYLCDGGDRIPSAQVTFYDDVSGLGLEDTVIHYETERGVTHVEPSNRVCIYAPRFGSVRKVTTAVTGERIQATQRVDLPHGPVDMDLHQPSGAVMAPLGPQRNVASRGPDAMRDRTRGVPTDNVIQPLLAEDVIALLSNLSIVEHGALRDADRPWLASAGLAAIAWASEEGAQIVIDEQVVGITVNDKKAEELKTYEFGEGRVRLVKLADRKDALPGEFVHFILRFDNVGDRPVNNVAILDNLTTRLEYVEDSQTCTKGAEFSTVMNEGQSLKLRWKLTEPLEAGEGCVIRFKCRVR